MEILPQFVVSFCVLTSVVVISQLVRLAEVIVTFGVTVENVMLPFLFIMLPFLGITIPISYLFAILMSYSRLSADGEIDAMLAAGISIWKVALPALLLGCVFYGVGALSSSHFEAWGRRQTLAFYQKKAKSELDNLLRYKLRSAVFLEDFLGYTLYAEKVSPDRVTLEQVVLAPNSDEPGQDFNLLAPVAKILGTASTGDLKMVFKDGMIFSGSSESVEKSVVRFRSAELDLVRIFQDQILGSDSIKDDYRSYPFSELWKYIDTLKNAQRGDIQQKEFLRARFLLHQRLSMPFAAVIFAFFGIILGLHNVRKSRNSGYVGAIGTVVVSYILLMGFKWLSEHDYIAAPLGAWLPNLFLLAIGGFLLYQKNRLPQSESPLNPHNIPLVNRLFS